jgi:hypothetical protein
MMLSVKAWKIPMRKYTGNTDGVAGGVRPGTTLLLRLCGKWFGATSLGTYSNRRMNNAKAKADPTNPKYLSVHATGRAVDLGYKERAKGLAMFNFLLANTKILQIEELHDYAYKNPAQDPKDKTHWGRGYRCSRGEGTDPKSIKIYDSTVNAGTPGGKWIHVELSPFMADNPDAFRAAWIQARKASGLK